MEISLRTKLILSFLGVVVIAGFLNTWVGVRLIGNGIVRQAQDKVRVDLNSAREIYQEKLGKIKDVVRLTATRFYIKESLLYGDIDFIKEEIRGIFERETLDILTLVDKTGRVIFRSRNPAVYGDNQGDDVIINRVLRNREVVASTEITPEEELRKEGEDLAERARISFIHTPRAKPRPESEETLGMMLKAAAPVLDVRGNVLGVLYGGILLNRRYEIVDKIKETVYQGEIYKGKDMGTATIFQGDLRISTNVTREDGSRAIGTRVSEEVYDRVLVNGLPWIERAFVVDNWYITAYEPIRNLEGEIIGMLYVGLLEVPYIDLRNRVVFTFLGITSLSIILLSVIIYFITTNITKPIKELVFATEKVARGSLSYRVQIKSHDEIGQLANSFNRMTVKLQKATDGYLALSKTLEKKVEEKTRELEKTQDHLIQSEKLTSMGKLAAGIAHEINNPLTSILINSHLILEKLEGYGRFALRKIGNNASLQEYLKLIIDETTRSSTIVKGLLEFSRQTPTEKKWADINEVIEKILLLMGSQFLLSNVKVNKDMSKNLPEMMIDINKIEQVFTNVILNALEAMPKGGLLSIRSQNSEDNQFVKIIFQDSGCGIPRENIGRIFDPFFTSKGTKGTGLGLSVSYGIVEQHRGNIDVQSKLGKGTTLTIYLPINEPRKVDKGNKTYVFQKT